MPDESHHSNPQPVTRTSRDRHRLIEHLLQLAREREAGGPGRAAIAELRRAAGKGPHWPAAVYKHVLPYLGPQPTAEDEEAALYVATLFALAPAPNDGDESQNLGAVLAQVDRASGSDSIERRFRLMLQSETDDLPGHLRHAVSLAQAKGVHIGWNRLFEDMKHLMSGNPDRRQRVIRQWARSFWAYSPGNGDAEDSISGNTLSSTSE